MKKVLFKMLRFSGLPIFFREFIQKNKVTILMFHDINKETAEKTFSYLQKNYNIIDLNLFIQACESRDSDLLPHKAMIITFDDGHIGNYEIFPIIKKYNIPITIFLCSSIINTNRHYWWKFKSHHFHTSELKLKSNKDRLEILRNAGFLQDMDFNEPQALQKNQITEMKHFVNFQSHTMFHPILTNCDDKESNEEIFKSKDLLEKEYDLKINAIAYPNGDYSNSVVEIVKKAGYICGITVDFGYNTINSDLYRLKRLSSNDTTNLDELIVKSSGVWSYLKAML